LTKADNLAGGDGETRLFLAMAYWQIGQKQEARQWYDKAIECLQPYAPDTGTDADELQFIVNEAERLMGKPDRKSPE